MCDYSLVSLPNRLAKEGNHLVVHQFPTGTLGLIEAPREVRTPAETVAPQLVVEACRMDAPAPRFRALRCVHSTGRSSDAQRHFGSYAEGMSRVVG